VFDDVFLNDKTTRRMVLADSIGPLVTVKSASEQLPGAAAGAPPPPPPLGGPPACAVATTPSNAPAIAVAAAKLADSFMTSPITAVLRFRAGSPAVEQGTARDRLGTNELALRNRVSHAWRPSVASQLGIVPFSLSVYWEFAVFAKFGVEDRGHAVHG
jgi:hypothetical protein